MKFGERFFQTKLFSRLSYKVCRGLSSPVLLRNFTIYLGRAGLLLVNFFFVSPATVQCAKKVASDSPELVDFAIGLVNSVFNLPDGQVMFFEELE